MNEHQREWLDNLRAYARSLGGVCLSTEYIRSGDRLRWRCGEGHEWSATANSIRQGLWCAVCSHGVASAKKRARTPHSVVTTASGLLG